MKYCAFYFCCFLFIGCSKDQFPAEIEPLMGEYSFNYFKYFWDVNNGPRYEYGPKDCEGKITKLKDGKVRIEYCGNYNIWRIKPDGSIIHVDCDVKSGSLTSNGVEYTISSNPCGGPGHGNGGFWYTQISGKKK